MNRRFLFLSALSSLLAATILRVLSCEIGFLGYYQIYPFACALFGLSIGFLDAQYMRMKIPETRWFLILVVLLVLVAVGHFTVLPYAGAIRDTSTFFLDPQYLPDDFVQDLLVFIAVFAAFTLTISCFVPLGASLGALAGTVSAERALVHVTLGACVGWVIYYISLSLLCPPAVLVALIGASFLFLAGRQPVNVLLVVIALAAAFACDSFVAPAGEGPYTSASRVRYSEYFKDFWAPDGHIQTFPFLLDDKPVGFGISTNQCAADFAIDPGLDDRACQELSLTHASLKRYFSSYFRIPYIAMPGAQKVLILGAGSGNEVAEALRSGAKQVDALDWRPWMFELGAEHPSKPFASAAVRKILADPRQYLKESIEKYDIIIFGKLESQLSFSPFGLLRTDGFRYTLEAFMEARDNLADGGFIALSCKPYARWYAWRLAHSMQLGQGHLDAILELPFRGYMFAGSKNNPSLSRILRETFKPTELLSVEKVMKYAKDIRPTFDDWPFLYGARANIPVSNLFCLVLMLVSMVLHLRPLLGLANGPVDAEQTRPSLFTRQNWSVMLLGAAFMVASAKLVMTIAFNFGTTWQIANAGAILVGGCAYIPAALATPARRLPMFMIWILVFVAYGLEYNFNYESVVTIANPGVRFLAAGILPLLPAFFASLAMVRKLSEPPAPALTFGMLLMGLVVGALIEHVSLFSTIPDLGIAGIVLCAAAMILHPEWGASPAEVQVEEPLV